MQIYRTKSFWLSCDTNKTTAPIRCFVIVEDRGRHHLSRQDLYRQSPFTVDQIGGAVGMNVMNHIESFDEQGQAIDYAVKLLDPIIHDMRKMKRWREG